MKKIFLIFLFLIIHSLAHANEKTILLKYKINEDLITNYDIIKEAKYLTALNKNLKEIEKEKLLEFAEKSLIREKIKKYELEKYYKLNYESSKTDPYIKNFMQKLNIENESSFQIYLLDYETNIEEIKKKILIELTWNKLIFDLYNDSVSINEEKISESLEKLIEKKKTQRSFELYEITFFEKNKENFDKKYQSIINDIESLGFEKAALIHSISNTSSDGGRIGWVNENQLSQKFNLEISNLDLGNYTKPINTGGGSIILQLKNEKYVSVEDIDKELELSKLIAAEKNRQLNEFSIIFYKKIENKSYVKKF
jgi:peptidyl-prolyl cis-trans isomerase SurA